MIRGKLLDVWLDKMGDRIWLIYVPLMSLGLKPSKITLSNYKRETEFFLRFYLPRKSLNKKFRARLLPIIGGFHHEVLPKNIIELKLKVTINKKIIIDTMNNYKLITHNQYE